jgi:hypothetical protein
MEDASNQGKPSLPKPNKQPQGQAN